METKLEKSCERCGGLGYLKDSLNESKLHPNCRSCKGTGRVVTDFGREVLDFMEKHLELKVFGHRT